MVMINEMIRLQEGDEKITAQRTVVEQQADAEAKAKEEKTVEQFLEIQVRYESDILQHAVQQHVLEKLF